MMKVRVRKGASSEYRRELLKIWKRGLPSTYSDYLAKLEKLEGKICDAEREGSGRILVYYPEPEYAPGGTRVVGISVEERYVEVVEG